MEEETKNTPQPKTGKDLSWLGGLGMFVWVVVLFTLVDTSPQYPAIYSQMEAARLWLFKADMDYNGVVTISDVWLWVKWLFFYPGDLLISFIMKFGDVHTFFELSADTFGNWFSGIISFTFWFVHIFALVCFFLVICLS